MPVVVDLPDVPATPMLFGEALKSEERSSARPSRVQPSFSAAEWDEFYKGCMKIDDGVRRVYNAIGMGCLAIVSLSITMEQPSRVGSLHVSTIRRPRRPTAAALRASTTVIPVWR